MSLLHDHKNGKATFRKVTYTTPASVHYFCVSGPFSHVFIDDEAAAIAWCARHKDVKRRAAFASNRSLVQPNLSLPDPSAPLRRDVPRDSSKITHDKQAFGKKKVRTF